MNGLDNLHINFSPQGLWALNIILGAILFGIALELKRSDFTTLWYNKRSAIAGLVSHFILLPVITFLLVLALKPHPGIALGMILVAACPGGNMSNMFTHFAKGNTALCVSLTSVSHLLAVVLTPINFSFYGSLLPSTAAILRNIHLSFFEVLQTIVVIVLLPLLAGMLLRYYKPDFAARLLPYMRKLALAAFGVFLLAAFFSNATIFTAYFTTIMPIVVLHNALALFSGYAFAKALKLPPADVKSITYETGVQNSGLGLILIFTFFNGMGSMALVAATWGLWHLISAGALAWWWSRK